MAMLASVGFSMPAPAVDVVTVQAADAYTTVTASTVWNTKVVTVNPCEATFASSKEVATPTTTPAAPVETTAASSLTPPAADTSSVAPVQSTSVVATPETSSTLAATSVVATSTTPTSTIQASSTLQTSTRVPTTTSVPATSTLASSTATTSSATPSSTGTGSGKRGLPYNSASVLSAFDSPEITWAYNWGVEAGGSIGDLEYTPMLWGLDGVSAWADKAQSAIDSGCTALLGFNEPDLPSQANIPYAEAATAWATNMNPFSGKATLVSPAVTNSELAGEGLAWLSSFLDACTDCQIDVLSFHWYGGADAEGFKNHTQAVYELGNKEKNLWITEFAVDGASDAEQAAFLNEVMPWLDSQEYVERYAFFGALQDILVSDSGVLTTAGTAYNSASS